MDVDMDIDLGLDFEIQPEPEPQPVQTQAAMQESAPDPLTEEAVYEKVHIRGVDELTTDDIKQFATSHFEHETPSRVEWIDDTSANLLYSSGEVGIQALAALTQVGEEDASALPPLRLRSAKLLASHPDSVIQVRSAIKSDRKQARSYEKSRFYLMHPEHDPREQLRQELSDRRRHGDSGDGEYRRRKFDDRELRRRHDRDGDDQFSANMYDDQPESYSDPERERSGRRHRGTRELFPEDEGSSGRLRNRSASPGRDTLEEADQANRESGSRRRFRERSPQIDRRNKGRELFPSDGAGARELFPNKPASSYIKKELFPAKASGHRRSDAFDAADETAHLLNRRISVPFTDGASDQRNRNTELFPDSDQGASMRGLTGDQGVAIRGASAGMSIKGRGASVRELFPSKFGDDNAPANSANAGKELFSDTLDGRGGRRRRAEDMFH
ncbi:hypothetical protein N7478_003998 [Penicillium angulare]|uniref:uncharacterized protein n=1 Tax=Penicillium angulare TaxID=116970 RepID=UPI002541796D|nr:uncharacterized protein N7478_003998 [Penicillium angulare]KAJ5278626.1 hypothetical protein N7478_003998 [Penicillium angulare]